MTRNSSLLIAVLLWASSAFAQATDQVTYYHVDAIGSVRMITDANGEVVEQYDYLPFGEQWGNQPADQRMFAGKERDQSTEFDYFGARSYTSSSGRFASVDPVEDIDASIADSQLWNRFSYAHNNPFRFVDPDGRETRLLIGKQTEDNVAGHVAIAINGVVFSFGTDWTTGPAGVRDWGANADEYLAAQRDLRQTEILTLKISAENEAALLASLKAHNPNAAGARPYDILFNSCVTACVRPLQDVGVLPGVGPLKINNRGDLVQAGAPIYVLPGSLEEAVRDAGLVKDTKIVGHERVSLWQSLWNTLENAMKGD